MVGKLASIATTLLLATQVNAPAVAQSIADFYRGKTVTIQVGFTAGGGYDLYARVLGRHIGRHIPGNPQVVVQNMPGAGSLKATQFVYGVAPKDGTVLATVSRGMATDPLLNDAKFDATRFAWIGSVTSETSVCATWKTSQTRTWDDMLKREFTLGGSATGADPDTFALILRNVFGAKVRVVTGYPGGNDINLAMERGEVDGRCGWSWSSLKSQKQWLPQINVLAYYAVERNAEVPNGEWTIARAKDDAQRQVLRLLTAGQFLGRPFFSTPDTPPDRKEALRAAFDATMKDPQFLAETGKIDLEVTPVSGTTVDKFLAELYAAPKDVVQKARAAVQK